MANDLIEGFVGGTVSLTVTNHGHAIGLALRSRVSGEEIIMSIEQSRRLRRILSAAEKRAAND